MCSHPLGNSNQFHGIAPTPKVSGLPWRDQCPIRGETTYLELTEQLCEGAMSARLAEFSAYYSNRMSYDEVAGLLERVTGQPVLSDQTIQHLVVAKAVEVSQQWQSESQADTAAPLWPEVRPQVDWCCGP